MRLHFLLTGLLVALCSGCGQAKPTPDAGPDTSCGLDCQAQTTYGLIINRCFEYSSSSTTKDSPPGLGLWVQPVFELEGGIPSIPVEYRQQGQTVQTDYFTIKNGDLLLLRRIAGNGSVTYRTDAAITGVKWLSENTAAGENFATMTSAFLSTNNSTSATAYRISTDVTMGGERKTPLGTYDNAIKVVFNETPDHGADSRRVFSAGTGFISLASPFSLLGGITKTYSLQRIRDIGSADAGTEPCSLGAP